MISLSKKAKRIGITVLLVVTALLVITFKYLVQPPPPPEAVPPSVQLIESRLVGRKDGVRQWEILSKSVLQAGDQVTLRDLDEIVMFQGEEPYLSIWTEQATWERKSDLLRLEGTVVVEGEDNFRLESDLLVWDGKQETLSSPGPVSILWNGMEIEAAEMILEATSNQLYLKNNVHVREGRMVWSLDEVVYRLDDEMLDFYGSLLVEGEVGESD
ncbi:MAG: LPS export ABC transporter periplasmic protein LptC [Firmicutes bacterium]|nr:LPS export ABC transporter periplasmic protein LptC [Bacillota bacterium]